MSDYCKHDTLAVTCSTCENERLKEQLSTVNQRAENLWESLAYLTVGLHLAQNAAEKECHDEVLLHLGHHLTKAHAAIDAYCEADAKSTPILPDQSPAYCESGGCACSEIFECGGACL